MTQINEIKKVQFLGSELMAAKDDQGTVWAGVSYICNGIGFTKAQKDTQVEKVQQDEVLVRGCRKFAAGVFDQYNPTLALKIEYVPLWLAKISVTPTMKREQPEVTERLIEYQLKAKDVLAAAFLPKREPRQGLKEYPTKSTSIGEIASLIKINRTIMRDQKSPPDKIAAQTELFYRLAGLPVIPRYVEPSYEQFTMVFGLLS